MFIFCLAFSLTKSSDFSCECQCVGSGETRGCFPANTREKAVNLTWFLVVKSVSRLLYSNTKSPLHLKKSSLHLFHLLTIDTQRHPRMSCCEVRATETKCCFLSCFQRWLEVIIIKNNNINK